MSSIEDLREHFVVHVKSKVEDSSRRAGYGDRQQQPAHSRTPKPYKIRTSTKIRRPQSLSLSRSPKYPRKSTHRAHNARLDPSKVILAAISTDRARANIECSRTLVFIVDSKSNKAQIKAALEQQHNLEVAKVRTLNAPNGSKKAYIKLAVGQDTITIAERLGVYG